MLLIGKCLNILLVEGKLTFTKFLSYFSLQSLFWQSLFFLILLLLFKKKMFAFLTGCRYVERIWHCSECPWQTCETLPATDLWYHLVAFKQQVCQSTTTSSWLDIKNRSCYEDLSGSKLPEIDNIFQIFNLINFPGLHHLFCLIAFDHKIVTLIFYSMNSSIFLRKNWWAIWVLCCMSIWERNTLKYLGVY